MLVSEEASFLLKTVLGILIIIFQTRFGAISFFFDVLLLKENIGKMPNSTIKQLTFPLAIQRKNSTNHSKISVRACVRQCNIFKLKKGKRVNIP